MNEVEMIPTFRLVIRPHSYPTDDEIVLSTAEGSEDLHLSGAQIARYMTGATVVIEMYRPVIGEYILYSYFSSNGECTYLY